jgi:hypothetical protein
MPMSTLERVSPYARQLLENKDVHEQLRRSAGRARHAWAGARNKKNPKKAVEDRRVRVRARQSAMAARDAVLTLRKAPQQEQRRRRRRRLLLIVAVVGSAGLVMLNERVRGQIAHRLGADGNDPAADPAPPPAPAPTSVEQ